MSFNDEVAAFDISRQNGCKVRIFLENQNEEELAKEGKEVITNEDLLRNRLTHTLKSLHLALKGRGFEFSDSPLATHLNGQCACSIKEKTE